MKILDKSISLEIKHTKVLIMLAKREQILSNSGFVKLSIHANILGVTSNRIGIQCVTSELMKWKYGGSEEGTNKQANNNKNTHINFKKASKKKWHIEKEQIKNPT